ncbi:MAG: hypothetical protein NTX71_04405 [Candidatus Aureabacteria bacterium]|nr:hypothetical protein [Candidatus Auribacterota bacterium]
MYRPILVVSLLVFLFLGCAHIQEPRINHFTGLRNDSRPKIKDPAVAIIAAPVCLVPDLVSNYVVSLYPGNLLPIQYMLWPISGLIWGIQDALLGYPFWSPSALYE